MTQILKTFAVSSVFILAACGGSERNAASPGDPNNTGSYPDNSGMTSGGGASDTMSPGSSSSSPSDTGTGTGAPGTTGSPGTNTPGTSTPGTSTPDTSAPGSGTGAGSMNPTAPELRDAKGRIGMPAESAAAGKSGSGIGGRRSGAGGSSAGGHSGH